MTAPNKRPLCRDRDSPGGTSVAPHCSNSLREVLMTVLWQAWPRAMGGKEWGKSLKLTASSPLKINGWNLKFLWEDLVFRSYMLVSGSVGFSKTIWKLEWNRYSLEVLHRPICYPQKENTVFQPPFCQGSMLNSFVIGKKCLLGKHHFIRELHCFEYFECIKPLQMISCFLIKFNS